MPIYKQEDGYLVKVSYKDKDGKYRKLTRKNQETRTRAGALKVEALLQLEVCKSDTEKLVDKEARILESMTFGDLIDDYMQYSMSNNRSSTKRQKNKVIRNHLLPYFGKYRINDFTPSLIEAWKRKMDRELSSKNGLPLSVAYKNTILKALRASLNYAAKYYGYSNNAYKRVDRFSDTLSFAKEKDIHYWTIEQFTSFSDALFAKCQKREMDQDPEWVRAYGTYVIFNILFFCGLRKGEAYPLHWTDIRKKGDYYVLSITKSLNQKDGYELTPPKNKSSVREVPICKKLLSILSDHYQRYQNVYDFDPTSDSWFICGGLTPIPDTTLENIKDHLSNELDLPRIKIHDLRHSFVSLLINSDVNIKTISKLVGHSTVEQTWNTYGHLYPDKENEAIMTIDKLTGM